MHLSSDLCENHLLFFSRYFNPNPPKGNVDDECSSEIRPVVSPVLEQNLPAKVSLQNIEQDKAPSSNDPWVRRYDQSISIESISNPEQISHQRRRSIQYETRPYYRSISSASDDCLSPQARQSLINAIDKDIEYVESRLRGQTTISLPNAHSTAFTQTIHWRPISTRTYPNIPNESKYSTANRSDLNGTTISAKALLNQHKKESVKATKRRIDKMKDQKAAKTLR